MEIRERRGGKKSRSMANLKCSEPTRDLLLLIAEKDRRGTIAMALEIAVESYAKKIGITIASEIEAQDQSKPVPTSTVPPTQPKPEARPVPLESKLAPKDIASARAEAERAWAEEVERKKTELLEGKTRAEWKEEPDSPDNPVKWGQRAPFQRERWFDEHPEEAKKYDRKAEVKKGLVGA